MPSGGHRAPQHVCNGRDSTLSGTDPGNPSVPNPFRPGELMDVKAKPASTRVKVLPLKALKDMV